MCSTCAVGTSRWACNVQKPKYRGKYQIEASKRHLTRYILQCRNYAELEGPAGIVWQLRSNGSTLVPKTKKPMKNGRNKASAARHIKAAFPYQSRLFLFTPLHSSVEWYKPFFCFPPRVVRNVEAAHHEDQNLFFLNSETLWPEVWSFTILYFGQGAPDCQGGPITRPAPPRSRKMKINVFATRWTFTLIWRTLRCSEIVSNVSGFEK